MVNPWNSLFLVGFALLAMVSVSLFSDIGSVTYQDVVGIGRDINGSDANELLATIKFSVNKQEHLNNFPDEITRWRMADDYSDPNLEKYLQSDVYILRNYLLKDQLSSQFFLLILYSQWPESFHNPTVCYRYLGYTIGKLSKDVITSKNISGNKDIPINCLQIYRSDANGVISERLLVMYTYFHHVKFQSGEFTIVRVSTPVASFESLESEQLLKQFMGSALNSVIRGFAGNNQKLITWAAGLGVKGYLILTVAFLIPLVMIIYPLLAKKLFLPVKIEIRGNQDTDIIRSTGTPIPLTTANNFDFLIQMLSDIKNSHTALEVYKIVLLGLEKAMPRDFAGSDTPREIHKKFSLVFNAGFADDFKQLITLVEETIYSKSVDDNKTTIAIELGEKIIKNLYKTS